jgi:hypothetical protein
MAQQQDQQAQAQGQAQQAQQNPVSPDVMKLLVSLYPNTVGSIKRQIEQILGLQPADPNEADVEAAKEAVYKHPDLPEKIADKAVAQAAPQLPQQSIPAPPGGVQPTPEPPTPDSPNAV